MKKFIAIISILALIPQVVFGYTVLPDGKIKTERGDTPLGVFGINWKEGMLANFGHNNPYKMPTNAIVDPVGWKPQVLGGFRSPQQYVPEPLTTSIDATYVTSTNGVFTNLTATTSTLTNIVNPSTKLADVIGSNITTDSGMENWVENPVNGFVEGQSNGVVYNYLFPEKSTDKQAGTYALKFNGGGDNFYSIYSQEVTSLSEGDTILPSFFSKSTNGGGVGLLAKYKSGENEYYFNWTGASAGTYSVAAGMPNADQTYSPTLTSSYAQFSTPIAAVVPAGITKLEFMWFSTDDDVYLDTATYVKNSDPSTSMNDFETWELYEDEFNNFIFGYNYVKGASSTYGTISQEGTIKHAGSYATKIVAGDSVYSLEQVHSGLTVGATYNLSIWGYTPSANSTGETAVIIANGTKAAGTQYWDGSQWVTGALASGITDISNTEDAWAELTDTITVPASGIINVILTLKTATSGDEGYFDDFTLKLFESATPITPNLFTNQSDYSLIDIDDHFCFMRVNGGATSTCMFGLDGLSDLIINKNQTCTKLNIVTMATSTATCL